MSAKNNPSTRSLGAEFEPADSASSPYQAWRELATGSLRGGSLEELEQRSVEGLPSAPLYTAEQAIPMLDSEVWALRRGRGNGSLERGWRIRQRYADPDLEAARAAILEDLEGGVGALELRLDAAGRRGLDPLEEPDGELLAREGLAIHDRFDLQTTLEGVRLELAPVGFDAGAAFLPAAALLFAQMRSAGVDLSGLRSCLGADPVSELARAGSVPQGIRQALEELGQLASYCTDQAPGVRAACVDTAPWSDAGAGEALATGMALATALVYLRAMVSAGSGIEEAARQIAFRVSLDTELFAGIAQLRALRVLWGRVLQECGVDPGLAAETPLEVATARRVLTRVDPWGNLLRITASTFSGVLGGADTILAESFDSELGLPSDLGRRLARNTQHVLAEESSLDRVVDPAGGSWYVENLTRDLALAAWQELQGLERLGGAVEALRDGALAERLSMSAKARAARVADGSRPLVGVSEFVTAEEGEVPEAPRRDRDALAAAARTRLLERRIARGGTPQRGDDFAAMIEVAAAGATLFELMAPASGDSLRVPPLPVRRLAEPYEGRSSEAEGEQR